MNVIIVIILLFAKYSLIRGIVIKLKDIIKAYQIVCRFNECINLLLSRHATGGCALAGARGRSVRSDRWICRRRARLARPAVVEQLTSSAGNTHSLLAVAGKPCAVKRNTSTYDTTLPRRKHSQMNSEPTYIKVNSPCDQTCTYLAPLYPLGCPDQPLVVGTAPPPPLGILYAP